MAKDFGKSPQVLGRYEDMIAEYIGILTEGRADLSDMGPVALRLLYMLPARHVIRALVVYHLDRGCTTGQVAKRYGLKRSQVRTYARGTGLLR